jgi:signal transduction histidine kinase/CheY-like chemotaxis protein
MIKSTGAPAGPETIAMLEIAFGHVPFETRQLALQAGPFLALALAMVVELMRRRRNWEEIAHRAQSSNEALRDELWRLKEASAERDRAEAASEAKSRFLATMSHEIRTPLHGILGMAELLREAALDPEPASYVEAIRASGTALSHLIDQILDFSKIEAGRLELVEEPFDPRRLVEEIVELLAPTAQRKGLEIAASIASDVPALGVGDSLRLRQALTNLAGNAVKFTSQGGVGVAVRAIEDGRLAFEVADTGPGVPEDRRAKIFDDFEQGEISNARHFEGTGLGLAISKRLVELMGGELTLQDNPGGGSIFAFSIPLPVAVPANGRKSDAVDLQGRRALIVADSPFEAPALATLLGEAGAEIRRADDLETGLEALQSGAKLDLVIVDCALGVEATNRLAEAARAAGAAKSLVLFSPFERRAFGQNALGGFDGWLVKPVRAKSLFERLASDFSVEAPARPAAKPRAASRASRALLAEDNDINAIIAQKALRRLGFDVTRARDGLEATRFAGSAIRGEAPKFDLVLMDAKMPGLDGYEATRAIRALELEFKTPPVGIIALTANAMPEDRATAEAAGVDEFLAKPFELARLAETIERALAAHARPTEATRAAS